MLSSPLPRPRRGGVRARAGASDGRGPSHRAGERASLRPCALFGQTAGEGGRGRFRRVGGREQRGDVLHAFGQMGDEAGRVASGRALARLLCCSDKWARRAGRDRVRPVVGGSLFGSDQWAIALAGSRPAGRRRRSCSVRTNRRSRSRVSCGRLGGGHLCGSDRWRRPALAGSRSAGRWRALCRSDKSGASGGVSMATTMMRTCPCARSDCATVCRTRARAVTGGLSLGAFRSIGWSSCGRSRTHPA